MIKFLNVLNKYKTIVGVVALVIFGALSLLTGFDFPNFQEPTSWLDLVKMVFAAIAAVYTPVGVADKIAKARTEEMRAKLIESSPLLQAAQEALSRKGR